jgi:PadR family transcriptional regulator, regulatory protein PadR
VVTRHDPQLLKGVVGMLLLRLLEEREDYGYALVVRLRELGFADISEGSVYPALTRMERQGLLTARLVPSTSGPARKYYHVTPAGGAELERSTRAWTDLVGTVAKALV